MGDVRETLPSWLAEPQTYEPTGDRDGFIAKSMLSVTSVLAQLRLDGVAASALSPSAPVKLVFALACILMVSLSRNFAFVLVVLAGVLLRAALMPRAALARLASVAGLAAALTLVLMLPAVLLGQPRSAILMAGKALVSTGIAMEVALSTPAAELTGALARFRVPDIVILTLDLALRSIVQLGETALEALVALRLRSVGRNPDKRGAMGGVGGVVLLKAASASQQTFDAMRCRGFEGEYAFERTRGWRRADAAWLVLLALLVATFAWLEGAIA